MTDVALAVLSAAACLALPEAIPSDGYGLRPPDHWWLVLMLLSSLPLVVHRRVPLVSLLVMAAASGTLQHLSYLPRLAGPDGTSIGPTYLAVATAVFLPAVRRTPWLTTFVAFVFIPVSALTEALLAPAGHRVAALLVDAVLLLAAWALRPAGPGAGGRAGRGHAARRRPGARAGRQRPDRGDAGAGADRP
ncbi:hypothetical protein SALBM135S_05481 [Streptomyces alboniger]